MHPALFLSPAFNSNQSNLDPYHTALLKAVTAIIHFDEGGAAGALNEVKRHLKADKEDPHKKQKLAWLERLYGDNHHGAPHTQRYFDAVETEEQAKPDGLAKLKEFFKPGEQDPDQNAKRAILGILQKIEDQDGNKSDQKIASPWLSSDLAQDVIHLYQSMSKHIDLPAIVNFRTKTRDARIDESKAALAREQEKPKFAFHG